MFSFWLYQKACHAQKIEETTLSIVSISSVHLDKNISFFWKESQNFLMQKFLRFYPANIQSRKGMKEYVLRYNWWEYKLVQHFYRAKWNTCPTDSQFHTSPFIQDHLHYIIEVVHTCKIINVQGYLIKNYAYSPPKLEISKTLVVKNPPANAGDTKDSGSRPGSGRVPGVGNGNLLQYSCLENSMGRRAWQVTVHRVTKSQTWWSTHRHTHTYTQTEKMSIRG